MVVLIDNYDSFSYNLYQLIGSFNRDVAVVKNDKKVLSELIEMAPSHIIISSGVGKPHYEGLAKEAISYFKDKCPILGVCLGYQLICEVFGGAVSYADKPIHGRSSNIHIANGSLLFRGLSPIIQVAEYRSLIVQRDNLPDELLIVAEDENEVIMAIKHRDFEIYGVQFHPESILTPSGSAIMKNFLSIGDLCHND